MDTWVYDYDVEFDGGSIDALTAKTKTRLLLPECDPDGNEYFRPKLARSLAQIIVVMMMMMMVMMMVMARPRNYHIFLCTVQDTCYYSCLTTRTPKNRFGPLGHAVRPSSIV